MAPFSILTCSCLGNCIVIGRSVIDLLNGITIVGLMFPGSVLKMEFWVGVTIDVSFFLLERGENWRERFKPPKEVRSCYFQSYEFFLLLQQITSSILICMNFKKKGYRPSSPTFDPSFLDILYRNYNGK